MIINLITLSSHSQSQLTLELPIRYSFLRFKQLYLFDCADEQIFLQCFFSTIFSFRSPYFIIKMKLPSLFIELIYADRVYESFCPLYLELRQN